MRRSNGCPPWPRLLPNAVADRPVGGEVRHGRDVAQATASRPVGPSEARHGWSPSARRPVGTAPSTWPVASRPRRHVGPSAGVPRALGRVGYPSPRCPSATYDAIVIGGGHNGLVAAAYLARAGAAHPGPRATARPRRRRRHRGDRPGLPLLRRVLRRQPAAAGDHPRARPAPSRPRDPAARRHVHAAACRHRAGGRPWPGLPVARQRPRRTIRELRRWSRPDAEAYEEYGRLMVEMARFIKPILGLGRRPTSARATRAAGSVSAAIARAFARLPRAAAGGLRPAHDDERARLPRPVVRDRPAEGDDVGVRDHRHVPGHPLAGHGLRAAPSLHGRDRRRVPRVGPAARRHRRRSRRRSHRPRERPGAEIRTEAPVARIRVRDGRGDRASCSRAARRSTADAASSRAPTRARRSCGLLEPRAPRRRRSRRASSLSATGARPAR